VSNFFQRSITGIFFVGFLILGVLWHPVSFFVLFLLIEILALREFFILAAHSRSLPQKYYGSVVGAAFFIAGFLWHILEYGFYFSLLLFPLVSFIFIFELYRNQKHPILNIASTLLGIFYVSVPLMLLNHIVFLNETFNGKILLGIFILIWACDTGAYVFGITLGRHRLFERISPKKSWEGFFGGVIISQVAAFLLSNYFGSLAFMHWGVIAAIVAVFGTLGDLVESMMKRSVGIKDSGNILPGHGGILDRFDSFVFAIPVIFTYLYFFIK
jgi:phosphatidate cytidylyltransferase